MDNKERKSIEIPEIENKKLLEENIILNDKYLRLVAEFDNYKKRTIKEKNVFSIDCLNPIFGQLFKILDDFERALETEDVMSEGVTLIYYNFIQILQSYGIEEIVCDNKKFDADFMEGVLMVESDIDSGIVIEVLEKGYIRNGVVIKFAKVIVSK